jgi:hypothetical protein
VISVDDLLPWLGNPSEPGVSTILEALETRAVEIVQSETDRYFGTPIEHVEQLVGDGSDRLYLRERPWPEAESVEATTVEYRAQTGDAWEAIAADGSDGWELEYPRPVWLGAVLRRNGGGVWAKGYQYRITYTFGYLAGEEPGDIRQAVIDLVSFKFHERGREGLKSETIGDYSYTHMDPSDLASLPETADTVQRWRGMVFA